MKVLADDLKRRLRLVGVAKAKMAPLLPTLDDRLLATIVHCDEHLAAFPPQDNAPDDEFETWLRVYTHLQNLLARDNLAREEVLLAREEDLSARDRH